LLSCGRLPDTVSSWGVTCAGDQSANLWWQLEHGLLPRRNLPDAVVVMIGTNDLGFLDGCTRWEADDLAAVPGVNSRCARLTYGTGPLWSAHVQMCHAGPCPA